MLVKAKQYKKHHQTLYKAQQQQRTYAGGLVGLKQKGFNMELRRRQQTFNLEPSRTQQHFRKSCDVKEIIRRSQLGMPLPVRQGSFGDFVGMDFQSMQNHVAQAKTMFMTLPPAIRARFKNDPAQVIEFMEDINNRAEAERLGLVKAAEPAPEPVPVTPT